MSDRLHIVCLDAPSPPDYGGAIDMFYKIKALAQTGKKINLHYFDYRPQRAAKGLENDCLAVYCYQRKGFFQALPLSCPFIVGSRINGDLINRLNEDNYPVLLEGLHCSGIVPFIKNPQRIVLRMHNNEAAYYRHLAQSESGFLKRLYFERESRLLQSYQQRLKKDLRLACLSETDTASFQTDYRFTSASFVPCFIPWQAVAGKEGLGDYCLYHGNMSVSENEEAALWLLQNIFSKVEAPLLIAGKGISKRLEKAAVRCKNVSLINNPTIKAIDGLIREAQVNVLPSMNNTGVKLKLLNALLNGRHCLTNTAGVKGSRIHTSLTVAEAAQDWIRTIETLMTQPFGETETATRKAVLALYDNVANAEKLNALWTHCQ